MKWEPAIRKQVNVFYEHKYMYTDQLFVLDFFVNMKSYFLSSLTRKAYMEINVLCLVLYDFYLTKCVLCKLKWIEIKDSTTESLICLTEWCLTPN